MVSLKQGRWSKDLQTNVLERYHPRHQPHIEDLNTGMSMNKVEDNDNKIEIKSTEPVTDTCCEPVSALSHKRHLENQHSFDC